MKATTDKHISGLKGMLQNWRTDLVAGLSVSLVALPLSLGVAIASGAPPMAGIISAIIGGILTTFIRSGHVSINGPSASLIVVTLLAVQQLSDPGHANGFQYVTAAFMVAGAIQLLFGLFKLGKYGNIFPSSVVQGMLAAIGVIILASQIHVGLGVDFKGSAWDSIKAIPNSLRQLHPFIAIIFANSLFILARHPYVKSKLIRFIPAPMWVLITSIPLFLLFQYLSDGEVQALGDLHLFTDDYLIKLPPNVLDGFSIRPNFSKINDVHFWIAAISIFLISTIETLLSAKAIDRLDPFKRKTNLNHELSAVGISTMVSGFLGGLPILAVIVRSSVNINHGAKTRYSNLYHGLIILALVFFLTDLIQMVPLAALAAILVYSGYKLASPKVFKDANLKGYEQLLILVFTLFFTIMTDLIWGIAIGVIFTMLLHLIRSSLPLGSFIRYIANPTFSLNMDSHFHVKVKGVANFGSVLKLQKLLDKVPNGEQVIFDFSHARLVDFSMLEYVHHWGEDYEEQRSGTYSVLGLDEHLSTSEHPYSLHVLPPLKKKRLSKRQLELQELSSFHHWKFKPELNWEIGRLRQHKFFISRPIEYAKNNIRGVFNNGLHWEVNDVTFDEGALMAAEVHHVTMLRIIFDQELPDFSLDREKLFDKLLDLASKEDIKVRTEVESFNSEFYVKGKNKEFVKQLFNKDLQLFLKNEQYYHIECQNNTLLLFKSFRILNCQEINQMLRFGELFTEQLHKALATPNLNPE